jgi:hypothetical protein
LRIPGVRVDNTELNSSEVSVVFALFLFAKMLLRSSSESLDIMGSYIRTFVWDGDCASDFLVMPIFGFDFALARLLFLRAIFLLFDIFFAILDQRTLHMGFESFSR